MRRRSRAAGADLPAKPNVLERMIAAISPEMAARRAVARFQFAAISGAGGYTGGSRGRNSMRGWHAPQGSADDALVPDLDLIRARSRDLDRNAPLARGAMNTITSSVIGVGLVPKPRPNAELLGLSTDQVSAARKAISAEWDLWANTTACDLRRIQTFAELQDVAFRSTLVAGDVFSPMKNVERPGDVYSLRVQLVEGERVDNPRGKIDGQDLGNGRRLIAGVEVDIDGAPVRYHFLKGYSSMDRAARVGGSGAESVAIDAFHADGRRKVLHIFVGQRAEQTRGEPILAPVIEALRQVADYTDAELSAALVSSLFTVFVTSQTGGGIAGAPTSGGASASSDEALGMQKGGILELAPGDDIKIADPSRPNQAFDPFIQAILRQVGVALELPFELLIKHFTRSYSASRAALLEAWRVFRRRRSWFAARFCQPYYEALLYEAVLRGRLDLPGFLDDPALRRAWCLATWRGPAPGQIDPDKEVTAAQKRIDLRISTHERETAELTGEDWEDVEATLEAEEARIGSRPALSPARVALPDNGRVDDVDQEEEED